MSACCNSQPVFDGQSVAYKRILWIVVSLNLTMFGVEMAAGLVGESMALQADALDFLGDSATYGLSLLVIGSALQTRAKVALFKGATLALLGLWVLVATGYRVLIMGQPDAFVMGGIGFLALVVNLTCALLLMRYRNGDANVRSVWLCSRNDAIGNLAVLAAATGVFASGTAWPDLLVAAIMAGLFLSASVSILRQARAELRVAAADPSPA